MEIRGGKKRRPLGLYHIQLGPVVQKSVSLIEGPEGVKWELGFAHFLAGKMGFHALGLGFINKKTIENGNGIKI